MEDPSKLDGLWPRVSDALLPSWPSPGLDNEDWYSADRAFVDGTFETEALPSWLRDDTSMWVRVCNFISANSKHTSEEESTLSQTENLPEAIITEHWPLSRSLLVEQGFARKVTLSNAQSEHGFADSAAVNEQDVVGASILRLVALHGGAFPWENIYPQDSVGKPCYNPGGKYIVKLFVGGFWRKVCIDDRMPINPNGQATIVHSQNRHELWPFILAKASYKVAYLMAPSSNVADFVALTTAALTGWSASPIASPPPLRSGWSPQAINELCACLNSRGTPVCSMQEINLADTSDIPGSYLKKPHSKSSGRRRGRSREPSEEVLSQAASSRNEAIDELRKKLMAPREQLVAVIDASQKDVTIKPVLGLVSISDVNSVGDKMLLEWSCGCSNPSDFRPGEASPQPVVVTRLLSDLLHENDNIVLLAFATNHKMPYTAHLSCSWRKASAGMGFVPPAQLSPTALHVNTSSESATLVITFQADAPIMATQKHDNNIRDSSCPVRPAVLTLEELVSSTCSPVDGRVATCDKQNATDTSRPVISLRLSLQLVGSSPSTTAKLFVPTAPGGRFYRVTIDAQFGANANFHCTAPVLCDNLSVVYEKNGAFSTTTMGTYDAVPPNHQVVLFRRAIRLADVPRRDVEQKNVTNSSSQVDEEGTPRARLTDSASIASHFFDVSLDMSVSHPAAAEHVTLYTLDVGTDVVTSHPLLRLKNTRIERGSGVVIITAVLCAPKSTFIPAGSWSLVAFSAAGSLSEAALFHNVDSLSGATSVVGSGYAPNKHLRLFRDMLEVPVTCFPIHIFLDASYGDEEGQNSSSRLVPVRFAIYESTKESAIAKQILHHTGLCKVCLPCFWPGRAINTPDSANVEQPNVKLIIEAELDSDIMCVEKTLYSPKPYTPGSHALHSVDAPSTRSHATFPLSAGPGERERIDWVLTVHASAGGVQILHHNDQEKARDALQQNWGADEPGRSERAATIRAQLFRDQPLLSEAIEQLASDRSSALGAGIVKADREIRREAKRVALCKAYVNTQACALGMGLNASSLKFGMCGNDDLMAKRKNQTRYMSDLKQWREFVLRGAADALHLREQLRSAVEQETSHD